MITVVVVKMDSAPRPLLANRCGGGRRSWVRIGDSERHVVAAEEVELPVMARALGVAMSAELVVVTSDLSEVLSSEGDGEVVQDRRMPIPFETSDGC